MEARPKSSTGHQVAITATTHRYLIRQRQLRAIIQIVLDHLALGPCEVSLTFVSSAKMRTLNRTYRDKDRTTDVLSFPQCHWSTALKVQKSPGGHSQLRKAKDFPMILAPLVLGDLVVSLPEAEKNAEKIGQGLDREVIFLIVHGLLHLCGHDHMHQLEEKTMLREQEKAMKLLHSEKPPISANRPLKATAKKTVKPLWNQVISRHKTSSTPR